jgi:hypothetical protein
MDDRRGGLADMSGYSDRSNAARIARTFSCRVLRIDGVFRRMLMPSEAETAKRAGTAVEKTNEVPLMHW